MQTQMTELEASMRKSIDMIKRYRNTEYQPKHHRASIEWDELDSFLLGDNRLETALDEATDWWINTHQWYDPTFAPFAPDYVDPTYVPETHRDIWGW